MCDNTNECLRYINEIRKNLSAAEPVRINLINVDYLTIDSILYLLSLVRNFRKKKIPFYLEGNLPRDQSSRELLETSGFYKYVKSRNWNYPKNQDLFAICDGDSDDPEIPKEICDFVIDKFELQKKSYTNHLFNIVSELILNTIDHAYEGKNTRFLNYWYAFVRYFSEEEKIKFTFLDSGLGIPATVYRRTSREKLFNSADTHTELLKSALNGEQRSKTEQPNRGQGLLSINKLNGNYIQKLTVISNLGYFGENRNKENILNESLNGTMFYWEINKKDLIGEKL